MVADGIGIGFERGVSADLEVLERVCLDQILRLLVFVAVKDIQRTAGFRQELVQDALWFRFVSAQGLDKGVHPVHLGLRHRDMLFHGLLDIRIGCLCREIAQGGYAADFSGVSIIQIAEQLSLLHLLPLCYPHCHVFTCVITALIPAEKRFLTAAVNAPFPGISLSGQTAIRR
jgi:hypothetical protein